MMLLPSIPTMVWGGNIRLIGRGLGLEIDEITEEVERLPLEETVDTVMGRVREGHPGRLLAQGDRKVGRHASGSSSTTSPASTRPARRTGPSPTRGWAITASSSTATRSSPSSSRADVPGGTRADGGNTTAANRLLGAIELAGDAEAGHLRRTRGAAATRRCHQRWKHSAGAD